MTVERNISLADWKDYLTLTKPRVVLLHVVTAAAAMYLAAQGSPPALTMLATLSGGALVAGAANAINCCLDRDIDGMMQRTRDRPLPSRRVSLFQAAIFSIITGLAGLSILIGLVNNTAAVLALGALVYYVLVYTIWLKRRTSWSSLIGSGAGAFPPLIGWLAVESRLAAAPFILFLIVVLWTPPHFWSLAIFHRRDYGQAGVSAVPEKHAGWYIFFSALGLVMASFSLALTAFLGWVYTVSAVVLGLIILFLAVRLLLQETPERSKALFRYSVIYLVLLFGSMPVDRIVG